MGPVRRCGASHCPATSPEGGPRLALAHTPGPGPSVLGACHRNTDEVRKDTCHLCGSESEWALSIFVINTLMLTGDSGVLSIHRGHICPGRENSSKEKQPLWGSWWWGCNSKKSTILLYPMITSQFPLIPPFVWLLGSLRCRVEMFALFNHYKHYRWWMKGLSLNFTSYLFSRIWMTTEFALMVFFRGALCNFHWIFCILTLHPVNSLVWLKKNVMSTLSLFVCLFPWE